jgi:phage shock protein C
MNNRKQHNHRCRRSRLYRDSRNGIFLGVCAGLADFFGFNTWAIRLAVVVSLVVFTFPTLVAYFFAGALLAKKPSGLYGSQDEEVFWRGFRTDPGQTVGSMGRRFRDMEGRLRAMEAHVTSPGFKLKREIDDLDR